MIDGFSIHLELIRNLLIAHALSGQEHHPSPLDMLLRTGRASNQLL